MNLIQQLKEENQDFEFYPTTKEMVRCIVNHAHSNCEYHRHPFGDVLDIGCGTCNFLKYANEATADYIQKHNKNDNMRLSIKQYYVMEKSRILLDRLPASAIVLGCDFNENTLIDKPVNTIFCNPPYSEYEEWTTRIIKESVCKDIYLIIPQRWKNSEKIKTALNGISRRFKRNSHELVNPVEVIGSFDFLDAERSARAKVDILYIDKSNTRASAGFDAFFDEVFDMGVKENKFDFQSEEYREEKKAELLTGKNKIEILCNGYMEAQNVLFEHFKVICGLDTDILETIGVRKENVKEALKKKFEGLKSMYWKLAFDCLDEITSRLTSTSRDKMMSKFNQLLKVDFNASNVYSLVIWVIKNANGYYKDQMIDFFMRMTSPENIQNYKSNQRVFVQNRWRYCNEEHSHYTLDYRIVCHQSSLPSTDNRYCRTLRDEIEVKISDVCTVARNLGFDVGETIFPEKYGKKGHVMMTDGAELFEFKLYMNGNVHLKFNKEFMKALNVVVAKELGWIHCKEDIAKEFSGDMAKGAEKYFDNTLKLTVSNVQMLMNN